ncbi:hypothetical protein AVEN_59663-1 [Araneus ventricosus]|uniref:Uncharacterized protein n=1 Tax=Araneus ventricosus TaxID=182803 RepID=A0A4Y2BN18_ARAVE|nr:hypothetical protein AVEN_59663-1 [Araneus ventricosus]
MRIVYLAACTTGGSHTNGSSGGVYHWWLTHEWFIWRRGPPVAHMRIVHLAACTTGGSHTNGSSGGVYHWWLTHEWFIWRRVPLVAHTNGSSGGVYHWWLTTNGSSGGMDTGSHMRIVHLAACTTGGSQRMVHLAAWTTGSSHANSSSGGVYHWWLTHEWFIWRRVPLVAYISYSLITQFC